MDKIGQNIEFNSYYPFSPFLHPLEKLHQNKKETFYSEACCDKKDNKNAREVMKIIKCLIYSHRQRKITGNFIKFNERERYLIIIILRQSL